MGFLEKIGLKTSRGDRIFIGIMLLILIHLLWMAFVEKYLPLWLATIFSVLLLLVITKWG